MKRLQIGRENWKYPSRDSREVAKVFGGALVLFLLAWVLTAVVFGAPR